MNILLLFLLAAGDQDPKKFPVFLVGKHYNLHSTAPKEKAQDLLDFMELVHATYMALLKPDNKEEVEKKKFTIYLYKDMEEYLASGAPQGSGAYYDGKNLVGYYDETLMKPFFAHEGMHQFTDVTSKSFNSFYFWFTEGIADCIGNCEVRNNKLYMCAKSGMIWRMRLPIIQDAIRNNKHYRLSTFLKLDRQKFMADADLCYAQAWSFCHFLITYPNEEDRNAQIPNGKFRRNLAIYYELMRAGGTNHDKAWAEAFKDIPLDALEELWVKYVMKLDAGKFLGIQGKELPPEDADRLGLGADFSGIRIDKVVPDGVAAKGRLQDGDVLVKFDGKRFPRGDAMNRLRVWMQEVNYGRAVKAVVLRDGKEVEALLTWTKPK
jgi:hypothetical protein